MAKMHVCKSANRGSWAIPMPRQLNFARQWTCYWRCEQFRPIPCQLRIQQARVIQVMNQGQNTTANWVRGSDKIPMWNNASPMPSCQTDDSQCLQANSSIGRMSFRSHFLLIIDFNKSWIPATSIAVGCGWTMQGRASVFCSAAGVGTRMNLLSSDIVRVQVLLKPGGQQNLQQVLWKSRK
jgi:hypothetical protein